MRNNLIATATFGLEAVVKREIEQLGYKIIKTEDGKVTYEGDERAIVRSNLWLRCADRVLLKIAEFKVLEFEDLFQQIKGFPWEEIIPLDGKIVVTGSSVKSKLSSVPACQSVAKKAIIERLKETYGIDEFEEDGAAYKVKLTILKDNVTVTLDTSGAGLHKRGYRVEDVKAPMKETLASALIQLSFWRPGRLLVDPCCGSGTIIIEAAMIEKNIAPGLYRNFESESWDYIPKEIWEEERKNAKNQIIEVKNPTIIGRDIDEEAIFATGENAIEMGVDDAIILMTKDVAELKDKTWEKEGIIVTNPPYGERIGEKKEIEAIYKGLGSFAKKNPTWSLFVITSDKEAEERIMGKKADRRRKLYNGRLETCYYQFHGEKTKKQ